MANQVEVGPWGGAGGVHSWRFKPDGRIVGFRVASADVIDSIRFIYEDSNHVSHYTDVYGGDGGTAHPSVIFNENEDFSKITGTISNYKGNLVITSLAFHTNIGKTYGVYGTDAGIRFSLPVTKGKFIGFFGKYGGFLDSFGIILKP